MRDGGPGAPGTELHDALQRSVPQPPRERRREPGHVRVVADRPSVGLEDHRVDRAERLGLRGERVQVLDDQLLAGVRDVQPVEAEVPRTPQQVPHGLGRHAQHVDVDQPVQVPEPLPAGLTFVQGRTERRADTGTDQTDEIRVLGHVALQSGIANVRTSTLAIAPGVTAWEDLAGTAAATGFYNLRHRLSPAGNPIGTR